MMQSSDVVTAVLAAKDALETEIVMVVPARRMIISTWTMLLRLIPSEPNIRNRSVDQLSR